MLWLLLAPLPGAFPLALSRALMNARRQHYALRQECALLLLQPCLAQSEAATRPGGAQAAVVHNAHSVARSCSSSGKSVCSCEQCSCEHDSFFAPQAQGPEWLIRRLQSLPPCARARAQAANFAEDLAGPLEPSGAAPQDLPRARAASEWPAKFRSSTVACACSHSHTGGPNSE